jgi:putative membrane protein
MQPALQFALESWSLPIPVTIAVLLAALFYLRRWFQLRRALPHHIPIWRAISFMSGLLAVWIAVASPLATLDMALLSAHMLQHLLLMTFGASFILLGAPQVVFRHDLPRVFINGALGRFFRSSLVQRLGRVITEPVFCWLAATTVLIAWHVPPIYAFGFESHMWHEIEHASFFAAGLLFWWPVIPHRPYDARSFRWSIVVYLFLATLPCDALSAFLAFCDRVVYTPYLDTPRHLNISPLQDQQLAGALMWVCVTFAYLVPAVILTLTLLSTPRAGAEGRVRADVSDALPDR